MDNNQEKDWYTPKIECASKKGIQVGLSNGNRGIEYSKHTEKPGELDIKNPRRSVKTKPFDETRLGTFCGTLIIGALFYLIDCMVVFLFGGHRNVTYFQCGIYSTGPSGFGITVIFVLIGLGCTIFGKFK
jgi:hypothetical protein